MRVACVLLVAFLASPALAQDAWLVRHQRAHGGWGRKENATEVTGLALLAFLAAGYTDQGRDDENPFAATVRRGLRFLLSKQGSNGRIGAGPMLEHAIATLALSEACWMTRSPRYRRAAQRALRYMECSRPHGQLWGNLETTVFCVMASRSAVRSGLSIDVRGLELVERRPWAVRSPREVAAETLLRLTMGEDRTSDAIRVAARKCLEHASSADRVDMMHWFFGTLALFKIGGSPWKKWNESMKDAIIKQQHPRYSGDKTGSWDPHGESGRRYGRAGVTALGSLCVGVYYRYDKVF